MRFIKLYEKITEWEWYDDVITLKVFLHLLLTANWKDTQWHNALIKRGQRVFSYHTLAKELHLSDKQVRTAIAHLKSTNEVTCERVGASKGQVAIIENYEKYQGSDESEGKQGANKRANERARQKANNGQGKTIDIPTVAEHTNIEEGKQEGKQKGKQEGNRYRTIEQVEEKNIPTVYKKSENEIYNEVVEFYNEECVSLPKVVKISSKRQSNIKARLKDHTLDEIRLAFQKTEASDFLSGRNGKWTSCGFDWLMGSETNLLKVLEGNYDNKDNKQDKFITDMRKITDGMTREQYEDLERQFR